MPMRCEYYLVCDSCSVYLGEDIGEEDELASDPESLVEIATERGWDCSVKRGMYVCKPCADGPPDDSWIQSSLERAAGIL